MKKIIILLFISMSVFAQNAPVLRHVVIFKFKETSAAADVQHVADTFYALKGKVSLIKDMEWGINQSPEHLDQGFTHCFVITFKSWEDLAAYQQNADHKAFQKVLGPHMDKVFVVDYMTKP